MADTARQSCSHLVIGHGERDGLGVALVPRSVVVYAVDFCGVFCVVNFDVDCHKITPLLWIALACNHVSKSSDGDLVKGNTFLRGCCQR